MNLSQIATIVEIANAGSISKAAQNLFVSQPGVSKILQKFEEEVGFQMFVRTSTGVRLTTEGRRFVDAAQDIIDQTDKLSEMFNRKTASIFMELNVTSMSYHFMQHLLAELYIKYSQNPINIRYTECGFDSQMEMINRCVAELGIATIWQKDIRKAIKKANARGIEYHRIGKASPYIGVSKNSKSYPSDVDYVDYERLSKMPTVAISPFTFSAEVNSGWDVLCQIFADEGVKTSNREIMASNTGTMVEMVNLIDGFSLIVLNDGIYDRYKFFDNIRLIPITDEGKQFELGWLQRANTVRSPLAEDFIGMIKEYATLG